MNIPQKLLPQALLAEPMWPAPPASGARVLFRAILVATNVLAANGEHSAARLEQCRQTAGKQIEPRTPLALPALLPINWKRLSMLNDLRRIAKGALLSAIPSPWKRQDIPRVAIQTTDGFDAPLWTRALDRELPDWRDRVELLCVPGDFAFAHAASDADACTTMTLAPALFGHARLKWINALPAGINLQDLPAPPAGMSVTTSSGIAARSMAEHALMLLLALRRQLPATLRNQQHWNWSQAGLLEPLQDLGEMTVAVFGLGAAGSEAARLCKALGMRVIGVRRSAENPHEHCDEICALSDFTAILPRADSVILTMPLTSATRDLFTDREFGQMKRSAILVNVARGGLIREDHLAAALREQRLGGAGLDVLSDEPPAAGSALKDCPNLIVTPHIAGNLHRFRPAIAARFARNLSAFLAGRPLTGLLSHDHWPALPPASDDAR